MHKYACAPSIQIFIAVNISTCICFIMDSQNKCCHISDSTWGRGHRSLAFQLGDSGFQAFYSCVGLLPGHGLPQGTSPHCHQRAALGTALLPLLEMHSMRVHFPGTTGGSWYWKPGGPLAELSQVQKTRSFLTQPLPRALHPEALAQDLSSIPPLSTRKYRLVSPFHIYTTRDQLIFLFRKKRTKCLTVSPPWEWEGWLHAGTWVTTVIFISVWVS